MIFQYNVKVVLSYNRFMVCSKNNNRESLFILDKSIETKSDNEIESKDIPGRTDGVTFKEVLQIIVYNVGESSMGSINKTIPNPNPNSNENVTEESSYKAYMCEINGILADNEEYARRMAEDIIIRICKEISLAISKCNSNHFWFQPRVEPIWCSMKISSNEYTPYLESRFNAMNNEGVIYLEDHVSVKDSVHIKAINTLQTDSIDINRCLCSTKNGEREFLLNEFYTALGSENIKSKFFHLYSIIEFCEKRYSEFNGANKIVGDENIDYLIKVINDGMKAVSCRDTNLESRLIQLLKSSTDIGRNEKIVNILKMMGITECISCNNNGIPIDVSIISNLTDLRNKSFHGTQEMESDAEEQYLDAIDKLMSITEQIIEYVSKKGVK